MFGFADVVAGGDDGVDNGPDAVAVIVGFDFLLSERFEDLLGKDFIKSSVFGVIIR